MKNNVRRPWPASMVDDKVEPTTVSSDYTAGNDDYVILADVSSNPLTVTMPEDPEIGKIFVVVDSEGNSGTNSITVSAGGSTSILDLGTDPTITDDFGAVQLMYAGSGNYVELGTALGTGSGGLL